MEEFTKSKVELAIAIEEQQHQIKLKKIEFKESYGLTFKQTTDNRFVIVAACLFAILLITALIKRFIT